MTLPSFTIKNLGQKDFFVIVPRRGIDIQTLITFFWNYNRDVLRVPFTFDGTDYIYLTTPNVDIECRRKKNDRTEYGIIE